MSTCYLSAKMRGVPDGNFAALDSLAAYMRRHDWKVYSPAENDRAEGLGPEDAANHDFGDSFKKLMRLDLWQVCDSDAIVLIPGWETSVGACLEKHVAEVVGTEVLYAYPVSHALEIPGEWFVSEVYMGDWVSA